MTYREVQYLADSEEFLQFVSKYNLKFKVENNQLIYLLSSCYIIQVYGLVVEDIFYFDIYSVNLKYSSTLNRLITDFDSEKLQSIYQAQIKSRKNITIPKLQGNKDNTLKAEQYFFTILQLMDELLSDIMTCKKEIKKEHWSPIFEPKKEQLKVILSDIIAKPLCSP